MTLQEFSDEFDVLYNNITSNQAPGLNEYEKSVFLTKAQTEILKNYFNPKGNKYQEGFDDSAKRQIDFSALVTTRRPIPPTQPSLTATGPFSSSGTMFLFPDDVLFVLNEKYSIQTSQNPPIYKVFQVVPLHYEEYLRLTSKPYKYPLKSQVWRLFAKSPYVEIISRPDEKDGDYTIRYIRRPQPIVLAQLDEVSIGGETIATDCELDPILHPEILQRAVELAKAAFVGDLKSSIELGQRSE